MNKSLAIITVFFSFIFCQKSMAFQQGSVKQDTQTSSITTQSSYTEIKPEKISKTVKDALRKDFPKANISIAYINKEGNYKLVLIKDKVVSTVYANSKGEWIEPNDTM